MLDLDGPDDFVVFGDNAEVLPRLPDGSFQLIYVDPPFNTGTTQRRTSLRTVRDDDGDRVGFQGHRYRTVELGRLGYADVHDDYLSFLGERLTEARRLLSDDGTLYVHIDQREVHYCKVLLDSIFGRDALWHPASSGPRRRPAASCPPTSGGTPSCRPTAARRPATPIRNPKASCAG